MSDTKTDPDRLPSVSGAEANQARKSQFIPIPGWPLAIFIALVVAIVALAVHG